RRRPPRHDRRGPGPQDAREEAEEGEARRRRCCRRRARFRSGLRLMSEIRLPEQNTVLLTGRLTRDAELKYTAAGVAMCRFSLAVNRRFKDPKSGEWKDDTSYVDVSVWREAAER